MTVVWCYRVYCDVVCCTCYIPLCFFLLSVVKCCFAPRCSVRFCAARLAVLLYEAAIPPQIFTKVAEPERERVG